ncbi:MAG TPA: hypothetical protein PKW95_20580 [bacterium]|nr:hypothetical protein [bacterium]
MVFRPKQLPEWATTTTLVAEPSEEKKGLGWEPGEVPDANYFNWFQNLVYEWVAYLDQLPQNVVKSGRYGEWRLNFDEDEGSFYLSLDGGTVDFINNKGYKITISEDKVITPTLNNYDAASGYRLDAISLDYDAEERSYAFTYNENIDDPLGGSNNYIAFILVGHGDTYIMAGIQMLPQLNAPRLRLSFGDGRSVDNADITGLHMLQEAIDRLNAHGGGIIEILGNEFGTWHDQGDIRLKSGVIIDGMNKSLVRVGANSKNPNYVFRMEGGMLSECELHEDPDDPGVYNRISGETAGYQANFFDVGIGSKVQIRCTKDQPAVTFSEESDEEWGIYNSHLYVIKEIVSENTNDGKYAVLVDENYDDVNLVIDFDRDINELQGYLETRVYVTQAGIRNLTLCSDYPPQNGSGYLIGCLKAAYTYDCFIEGCNFIHTDPINPVLDVSYFTSSAVLSKANAFKGTAALHLNKHHWMLRINKNRFRYCEAMLFSLFFKSTSLSEGQYSTVLITDNIFSNRVKITGVVMGVYSGNLNYQNPYNQSELIAESFDLESDFNKYFGILSEYEAKEHNSDGSHKASLAGDGLGGGDGTPFYLKADPATFTFSGDDKLLTVKPHSITHEKLERVHGCYYYGGSGATDPFFQNSNLLIEIPANNAAWTPTLGTAVSTSTAEKFSITINELIGLRVGAHINLTLDGGSLGKYLELRLYNKITDDFSFIHVLDRFLIQNSFVSLVDCNICLNGSCLLAPLPSTELYFAIYRSANFSVQMHLGENNNRLYFEEV